MRWRSMAFAQNWQRPRGTKTLENMMDTAHFKACVTKTLDAKPVKDGLRLLARKNQTTHVTKGVIGFNTSVGALMYALEDYTLGLQLTQDMRDDAAGALADCLYYGTVLAKAVKVTVPGSGKKVRLHGMTMTKALLELNATATRMLIDLQRVLGADDGELDIEKIGAHLNQAFGLLWPLTTELTHKLPAELMAHEIGKLAIAHPEGFFDVVKKPRAKKLDGVTPAVADSGETPAQ